LSTPSWSILARKRSKRPAPPTERWRKAPRRASSKACPSPSRYVPEQRMDARIAAEIGIRLRRPLHRERRQDHRIRLEEREPAAQDAGSVRDSLHVTAPVEDRRHLQKAVECLSEVGAAVFAHLRLLQHRKLGHDEVAPKSPGACQIG